MLHSVFMEYDELCLKIKINFIIIFYSLKQYSPGLSGNTMKFEDTDDDTEKLNYNYYDTDYGHGQGYMDYGYPQGYGKYLNSLFYLVIFNSSCLNTTPQELRRI